MFEILNLILGVSNESYSRSGAFGISHRKIKRFTTCLLIKCRGYVTTNVAASLFQFPLIANRQLHTCVCILDSPYRPFLTLDPSFPELHCTNGIPQLDRWLPSPTRIALLRCKLVRPLANTRSSGQPNHAFSYRGERSRQI